MHIGRQFGRETGGTVAVTFALAATALLGAIGLALDTGRYHKAKIEAQSALDGAVLAASGARVPDSARRTTFEQTFWANFKARDVQAALSFTFDASNGGSGTAEISLPTSFMSALGIRSAQAVLTSSAKEAGQDIEVVLAMDISGSMNARISGAGTRLDAMKSALDQMLTSLSQAVPAGRTLKVSLVPFNMAVNIGTDKGQFVSGTTHPLFAGSTWAGCVLERPNGYHHRDTYRATATDGSGKWPAYIWPPAPNTGASCLNPSNGTNRGYSSVEPAPLGKNPWMNGPNFNCPRYPIVPLSDNLTQIRNAINDLVAYGNMGTTIGPAVGWASRVLSPDEPFVEGAAYGPRTRKIIVVLTDGEMVTDGGYSSCASATNSSEAYRFDPADLGLQGRVLTSGPSNDSFTPYGYLQDSNPYGVTMSTPLDADRELDRLSLEACATARAQPNVEIFTIGVSSAAGPGTRAHGVLTGCASTPSNAYFVDSGGDLANAFLKIAEKAAQLRITN